MILKEQWYQEELDIFNFNEKITVFVDESGTNDCTKWITVKLQRLPAYQSETRVLGELKLVIEL